MLASNRGVHTIARALMVSTDNYLGIRIYSRSKKSAINHQAQTLGKGRTANIYKKLENSDYYSFDWNMSFCCLFH
ncbi:hypothetical protein ERO13_D02G196850v2 [Gossypium hirsutum]|uniref:Uncharacterized protein n=2 Tax=Gossypium TaxID=3633 RepID=A0A0D2RRB1_GOSRA|nr:hypothetical protein ERO13_D02G196850v2 [Gossypium hirsutum]KJB32026.1 hypothetical protein B456_005G219900 [Gossypium raimondii]TYH85145.1 hypothetical protein ES332_D02G245600v1 [Gossypium tomentosum]